MAIDFLSSLSSYSRLSPRRLTRHPTIFTKMHSFSTLSILFTAALSVFTNAAPISPSGVNLGDALSTPQLSGVPNTGGLNLRAADTVVSGAVQSIESKVTSLNTREDSPSVAVIFSNVITEITPYTEQLSMDTPDTPAA
jgi:hypothetical protein